MKPGLSRSSSNIDWACEAISAKEGDVIGDWSKLHDEKFNDL